MTDDEVKGRLQDAIARAVTVRAPQASATAAIVMLNGSVLRVLPRSSGGAVALITMTFYHPIDTDPPNPFYIARSNVQDTLIRLDGGDSQTIDAVATELADVFVRQARRP